MFVIGNFIKGIANVLNFILTLYIFLIIIRAIISWININPHNRLVELLHKFTEPVLAPIRRKVGTRFPIDISPIIVIIIIMFLQSFLVDSLHDAAARLVAR